MFTIETFSFNLMNFPRIFLLTLIVATFISCGGATHHLASGEFSKNESYHINSYYGCCGCTAEYFMIDSGKRKTEQVIYSYNCHQPGKPTKFVFNYNKKGRIVSCDKYVATTGNDYVLKISDYEKRLFSILDTSSSTRKNYSLVSFQEIKGFRKPTANETTHEFPLINNGSKLPVN